MGEVPNHDGRQLVEMIRRASILLMVAAAVIERGGFA
jgi:hypothetical protein